MENSRTVSLISIIASSAGALLFLSVLIGAWNYSAAGGALLAGIVLAAIGAIAGFIARRSGKTSLNLFGLALGIGVVVCSVAFAMWMTPSSDSITIEEIRE